MHAWIGAFRHAVLRGGELRAGWPSERDDGAPMSVTSYPGDLQLIFSVVRYSEGVHTADTVGVLRPWMRAEMAETAGPDDNVT